MNVNKWGPGGWEFLHSITFNYPLEDEVNSTHQENYRNFFESIGDMLPCKYCRESYKIYYKYIPIDQFLDSRQGVVYWLYKIHELIDEKIFKPNASLEDVIRKYEDMRAKCGKMSRDGNKDKQYKTCQAKPNLIDQEYLANFLTKANSYEPIFDELKIKLYASDENPNKKLVEKIIYPVNYKPTDV